MTKPPTIEDLMDADRAFAADAEARGLEGWTAWFTEDAARPQLGTAVAAVGKAAIREADGPMFAPGGPRLRWEPAGACLFDGGTEGYTTGRYTVVQVAPDGGEAVLSKGAYLSLWRRGPDGWRVYLDTGAPDVNPE